MHNDFSESDLTGIPARFHRTALFYGGDGFQRIREASVTIIGLGGVGGHAAVNLARTGVGHLHLIDFDLVNESSLNRSPFAEPSDIGHQKTGVLARYLNRICPDTKVRISEAFCREETIADLLPASGDDRPEVVLDAIDSLNPKVGLLAWCHDHGIKIFSSMGAAGKMDAGQVRTGDISETRICPLAKFVRSRLRRRGVFEGIPCIWSLEQGDADRPDAAPESENVTSPHDERHSRKRNTLASQMTMPGVFGYGLASMILDHIISKGEHNVSP